MNKILCFLLVGICMSCGSRKINESPKAKFENDPNEVFKISDGTNFTPKQSYPSFNWNVTPQYFMFADGSRLLTDNERKTIAEKTAFICIEKNHAYRALDYAEIGAKEEIVSFKKLNPNIKALYYFNSAYAWPFTSYNKDFTLDRIDKNPKLKSFLIKNKTTGELEKRRNTMYFDVLNPEFRAWWVKTVAQGVKDSGADGVFIDQMHGFVWLRQDKRTEVEHMMGDMMSSLKKALGSDKIVLGNNASHVKDVFPSIDAAMFEHYNEKMLSKENLLKEWGYMLDNAKAGKISVFRIGVEAEETPEIKNMKMPEQWDALERVSQNRLEYYLAAYLIGAQPYSYLQYGWGWRLDTGPLVDYPLLNKPLGAPKGAYKRVKEDGWEFTREFEHASVWIDTENKKSEIKWLK